MSIVFFCRDMSDEEYKREQAAFDEHSIEFGNPPDKQERIGFVATDNGKFIGASSGLLQRNNNQYGKYFYLSDLFVEKEYRQHGYGKKLLNLLEEKIKALGAVYIWAWTAEYEGASFYIKQGYTIFATFENFYPSGHARIGVIKKL